MKTIFSISKTFFGVATIFSYIFAINNRSLIIISCLLLFAISSIIYRNLK